MQVSDNERKIENLRKDHETWGQKLHELQMEDGEDEDKNKARKSDDPNRPQNAFSPEIDALDHQIAGLSKGRDKSEELNKKVNLVNDQVHDWCSKVIQKVDQ